MTSSDHFLLDAFAARKERRRGDPSAGRRGSSKSRHHGHCHGRCPCLRSREGNAKDEGRAQGALAAARRSHRRALYPVEDGDCGSGSDESDESDEERPRVPRAPRARLHDFLAAALADLAELEEERGSDDASSGDSGDESSEGDDGPASSVAFLDLQAAFGPAATLLLLVAQHRRVEGIAFSPRRAHVRLGPLRAGPPPPAAVLRAAAL